MQQLYLGLVENDNQKFVSLNERGKGGKGGGIGVCQRFPIDGKDKLTSFSIYEAQDVRTS